MGRITRLQNQIGHLNEKLHKQKKEIAEVNVLKANFGKTLKSKDDEIVALTGELAHMHAKEVVAETAALGQ